MSEERPGNEDAPGVRRDQRSGTIFVVGSALAFLIIAAAAIYVLVRRLV